MEIIDKIKKDKIILILLIIVFILGLYIRFNDFYETGYWSDDQSTIPAGLLWFYPHTYFPALSGLSEPPLGNIIIGASCMLSGKDFSQVSQIQPGFYPGREILLGESLIKAYPYCHISMYIFGILLMIVITILAFSVLNKYSALFFISFFMFKPVILQFSRWIHVDIILYVLITTGFIFLWKAYKEDKYSKKEKIYFIISFTFFALSLATKFSAASFILFGFFIFLEKYHEELFSMVKKVFKMLENKEKGATLLGPNEKGLISKLLVYITVTLIALLTPFKLNPNNFYLVYEQQRILNPILSHTEINLNFFNILFKVFLKQINLIDIIVFLFSISILISIIIKNKKSKKERLIIYSILLFIIFSIFFSKTLSFARIALPYLFGLVFIMSLIFSDKTYSFFNRFKIKNKKVYFTIFMLIYILFSFNVALSISPHFTPRNNLFCKFSENKCKSSISPYVVKQTAEYLKSVLKDNETFMLTEGTIFYYIRSSQGILNFQFEKAFEEKIGKPPTALEKIKYFHPENQTVRYLLIDPYINYEDKLLNEIKNGYTPIHKIYLSKEEALWIYDLENLVKR